MKKLVALFMTCVMLLSMTLSVQAGVIENDEWYELVEEEVEITEDGTVEPVPYGQYLINIHTSLANMGSGKLGIRADVFCASKVAEIQIIFHLQKKSGSTWNEVGKNTLYAYNVSSTAKTVAASGCTSGTYRAYVEVKVSDSYGYAESLRCFTDSLTI